MGSREANERNFPNWEDLPDGGRRYWIDRPGAVRGWARYIKVVDADENTVHFVQEIYSELGELVARHQKFPEDLGHEVIQDEAEDE